MEFAESEISASLITVAAEQIHDLPFSYNISDFLRRIGRRTRCFAFGRLMIEPARFHEIVHRLIKRPFPSV